jgi:hypothetical protein
MTLQRITLDRTKKTSINLKSNPYYAMDEVSLGLANLSPCRIKFVKRVLRKKVCDVAQVSLILAYALFLLACFVMHDVQYEERCKAYLFTRQEITEGDKALALTTRGLLLAEIVLLGLFVVEIVLHTVGYGLLYFRNLVLFETFMVLVNFGLIVALYYQPSLFGAKSASSTVLLVLRFETLRLKLPILFA